MIKVSVIISICDNRYTHFCRSLDTWERQTMPKEDFEIIIIDDADRKNIRDLCSEYSKRGLNFQYIRIDNSAADVPVTTFIPVLSNNVGFRNARGDVVVITGPETLQAERNLEIAYSFRDKKQCAYGLVYCSNSDFVNNISRKWNYIKDSRFSDMLSIQGAKTTCYTRPPHPPAYWFLTAVAKRHVELIGGVDERFATGICAEDDDFANRMKMNGIVPVFDHKMVGIHQDHSSGDKTDKKHSIREEAIGKQLRKNNINLMKANLRDKLLVANLDHIWGDPKTVISKEFLVKE